MDLISCVIAVIALIAALLLCFIASMSYYLVVKINRGRAVRCPSNDVLNGKTVLVTGGNAGIGRATAEELAKRRARVIIACRNVERAKTAVHQIQEMSNNNDIAYTKLDLADLDSVVSCAEELMKEKRLDVLILNAGCLTTTVKPKSKQGYDITFGVNHLGHFLLAYKLMEKMKANGPSRIVVVSSYAHYSISDLDFTKEDEKGNLYPYLKDYPISKFCNVLFVKEIARQFKDSGITSYAVDPGAVVNDTVARNKDDYTWKVRLLVKILLPLLRPFFWSTNQGAQTSIYCAVDKSLATESGKYYARCAAYQENKATLNEELSKKLWDESLEMVKGYIKKTN